MPKPIEEVAPFGRVVFFRTGGDPPASLKVHQVRELMQDCILKVLRRSPSVRGSVALGHGLKKYV